MLHQRTLITTSHILHKYKIKLNYIKNNQDFKTNLLYIYKNG